MSIEVRFWKALRDHHSNCRQGICRCRPKSISDPEWPFNLSCPSNPFPHWDTPLMGDQNNVHYQRFQSNHSRTCCWPFSIKHFLCSFQILCQKSIKTKTPNHNLLSMGRHSSIRFDRGSLSIQNPRGNSNSFPSGISPLNGTFWISKPVDLLYPFNIDQNSPDFQWLPHVFHIYNLVVPA